MPSGRKAVARYDAMGEPIGLPGRVAYRAVDREAEVQVELWLIRPDARVDRAVYLDNAARARELSHANVRRLFAAGEEAGSLYAAVQQSAGSTLGRRLASGKRVSDNELLGFATGMCRAIAAAHEVGLIHGRLSPVDVVDVQGAVKVGGIGLWGRGEPRSVWGDAARYVAPEAWDSPSPASDVFSIGAILAQLACGGDERWLIEGDASALQECLASEHARLPLELRAALAPNPAHRPRSPLTLVDALARVLSGEAIPTRAPQAKANEAAETRKLVKATAEELDLAFEADATVPRARVEAERRGLPLAAEPSDPVFPQVIVEAPQQSAPSRRRRPWPLVAVGTCTAILVGLGTWAGLSAAYSDSGAAAPTSPPSARSAPAAPRADRAAVPDVTPKVEQLGPCPANMALIDRDGLRFCIDAHEAPGQGRMPWTGISLAEAENACGERQARLCSPEEWELACRGPEDRSFPYGDGYRRGVCNADEARDGRVGPAGAFTDCKTAEGLFDMSGNVAEWVSDGRPRGGSAQNGDDGRCSRRFRAQEDRQFDDVGFRCCKYAAKR